MGGRPRKPTAALELNGAYVKDPQRKRDRENEPQCDTPLGDAPAYLGDDGKNLWDEMASEAHWLRSADAFMFEVAVKYMTLFRSGVFEPKLVSQLISVLNKLGFGPADRSKIKAPGGAKEKDSNPFAEFA